MTPGVKSRLLFHCYSQYSEQVSTRHMRKPSVSSRKLLVRHGHSDCLTSDMGTCSERESACALSPNPHVRTFIVFSLPGEVVIGEGGQRLQMSGGCVRLHVAALEGTDCGSGGCGSQAGEVIVVCWRAPLLEDGGVGVHTRSAEIPQCLLWERTGFHLF